MTLLIAILATITATVILITKLIELQVAQAKLKELAITSPIITTAPKVSKSERKLPTLLQGFILPVVFIIVIILVFASGWVSTRFGLGVVVFCSIATPFYAIMPFLFGIIGNMDKILGLISKQSNLSGSMLNLHTTYQNKDTQQ